MRVGVSVECAVCHRTKKPHGRSAPIDSYLCDSDCEGYYNDPLPGCLWPGETEEDFGYKCCDYATRNVAPKEKP